MTPESINSWLSKNRPEDVLSVKMDAAEWYSGLPIELRKSDSSLILLELAIIVFEWNKKRKDSAYA